MKKEVLEKANEIQKSLKLNIYRTNTAVKVVESISETTNSKPNLLSPITCPLTGTCIMVSSIEWRELLIEVIKRQEKEYECLKEQFNKL